MVLRSAQFDDLYFSRQDGLAETHHVFLKGNDLPGAWQGSEGQKERFVVAETGFGTGLNFLAVWKLFEERAGQEQALDYISFEEFPLGVDEIRDALSPLFASYRPPLLSSRRRPGSFSFKPEDSGLRRDDGSGDYNVYLGRLLELYTLRVPGFHRIILNERVTLTLVFDDVNAAMEQVSAEVDCWFLDGFKPSANPEMWSETVFQQMARLSNKGASFATFTAAGFVKRGLRKAGFEVRKVPGFGSKREMLVGQFK